MKPLKLSVWKFNILVLCILLGFLISLQIKNVNGEYLYVPLETINEYRTTITTYEKEIGNLQEIIEERKKRINEYTSIVEEGGKIKETMIDELEQQRRISGFTDVEGQGIVLVVNDATRDLYEGENPNDVLVHDLDILNLINDLKEAGAEAISVNGQRLLPTSEINCNGHNIRVNGRVYAQPFIIKAIGESKTLEAALIAPESYGNFLKEFVGLYIEVDTGMNIKIPGYSETIKLEHLKVKEEGD